MLFLFGDTELETYASMWETSDAARGVERRIHNRRNGSLFIESAVRPDPPA